jgi:hypothetical protein
MLKQHWNQNVFDEQELTEDSVVKDFLITAAGGKADG